MDSVDLVCHKDLVQALRRIESVCILFQPVERCIHGTLAVAVCVSRHDTQLGARQEGKLREHNRAVLALP